MNKLETVEALIADALSVKGTVIFTVGRTRVRASYMRGGEIALDINGWPASVEGVRHVLDVLQSGSSRRFA